MSVFKDDQTTYTGNVTILGSLNVSGSLVVTGGISGSSLTIGGNPIVGSTPITNSLGADVLLNNTANYFQGPSIAQGTVGTWFASGTVLVGDTGAANIQCKLWDGTTVISSGSINATSAGGNASIALSGYIVSPADNLRISCKDVSSVNGKILFNFTGNSKDSTISAIRIA